GSVNPSTANLTNVFREIQGLDPTEREERLQRFVLGLAASPDRPTRWDDARTRLRPGVRASSWVLSAPRQESLGRRPLAPFLSEIIMLDAPDTMSFVYVHDLERWGVDETEAWATAAENLWTEGIELKTSELPGAIDVPGPDGYQTSALATPERLRSIISQVP